MKLSLRKLINKRYTDRQKMKVAKVVKDIVDTTHPTDEYLLNYKVLEVGVAGLVEEVDPDRVIAMYGVMDPEELTEVDYVLANIILTIEELTGEQVYEGYQKALTLDPTQPEFDYLVNKVDKLLETNEKLT